MISTIAFPFPVDKKEARSCRELTPFRADRMAMPLCKRAAKEFAALSVLPDVLTPCDIAKMRFVRIAVRKIRRFRSLRQLFHRAMAFQAARIFHCAVGFRRSLPMAGGAVDLTGMLRLLGHGCLACCLGCLDQALSKSHIGDNSKRKYKNQYQSESLHCRFLLMGPIVPVKKFLNPG